MGNILVLLTKSGDEQLACIVVMYYNVIVTQQQLQKIISKKYYTLLKHIWKNRQNYVVDDENEDSKRMYTYVDLIRDFRDLDTGNKNDDHTAEKSTKLKD